MALKYGLGAHRKFIRKRSLTREAKAEENAIAELSKELGLTEKEVMQLRERHNLSARSLRAEYRTNYAANLLGRLFGLDKSVVFDYVNRKGGKISPWTLLQRAKVFIDAGFEGVLREKNGLQGMNFLARYSVRQLREAGFRDSLASLQKNRAAYLELQKLTGLAPKQLGGERRHRWAESLAHVKKMIAEGRIPEKWSANVVISKAKPSKTHADNLAAFREISRITGLPEKALGSPAKGNWVRSLEHVRELVSQGYHPSRLTPYMIHEYGRPASKKQPNLPARYSRNFALEQALIERSRKKKKPVERDLPGARRERTAMPAPAKKAGPAQPEKAREAKPAREKGKKNASAKPVDWRQGLQETLENMFLSSAGPEIVAAVARSKTSDKAGLARELRKLLNAAHKRGTPLSQHDILTNYLPKAEANIHGRQSR